MHSVIDKSNVQSLTPRRAPVFVSRLLDRMRSVTVRAVVFTRIHCRYVITPVHSLVTCSDSKGARHASFSYLGGDNGICLINSLAIDFMCNRSCAFGNRRYFARDRLHHVHGVDHASSILYPRLLSYGTIVGITLQNSKNNNSPFGHRTVLQHAPSHWGNVLFWIEGLSAL